MTILVVDDNQTNRKLLRITLQAEGHQTVEARDGVEALDILKGRPIDAIISDILMPRMDGYRLCHEARSIERIKDIPFILYSSTFTTQTDERLALDFGADRFIRKPAPVKEILDALVPSPRPERLSRPLQKEKVAELSAMQGYSEALVGKLEDRNSELQLTREQLLTTNRELVERSEELQTAKTNLEVTANQLQSLFDNLDDVFFSVDMKTPRLLQISPACMVVFGQPQQAFFDNPMLWKDVTLPADRNLIEQAENDLRAGRNWQSEYRIQKPDGKICWVQSKIKPHLDGAGSLVRTDGVVSDISARKQLEAELLHSQKLEAIGRLSAGIAHDFNNLLTAILGYSELALSSIEQENPLYGWVEEIRKAGARASELTRQLLAFGRKQVLDPRVLDLNAVLSNAEGLLRRLIGDHVQLTILAAPELKPIRADAGQLEQVIVNLAVNARDAMPNGGRLTIQTSNLIINHSDSDDSIGNRPGAYVMLKITDTGNGMTTDVQSHVFEPFFTTKPPGKGTGLGLATVHGVVEQSGGHIRLDSKPDRGTTFSIYLPQAEAVRMAAVPVSEPSEPDGPVGRGGSILVAEDDEVIRKLVTGVLRGKGYSVIEARDGEQALELWHHYPGEFDLLLTDVVMPGMTGPHLSEKLRRRHPKIRILYMSSYTGSAELKDILQSGDAFLPKPFGPDVLARKVSEVLGQKPNAGS